MEKGNSVEARSQLGFCLIVVFIVVLVVFVLGVPLSLLALAGVCFWGGGGGEAKRFDAPIRLLIDISSILNIPRSYLTGLSMFNWALTGQ